jgi:hypothetical protein
MDQLKVVVGANSFKVYLEGLVNVKVVLILLDESVILGLLDHICTDYLNYDRDLPVIVEGFGRLIELDQYQKFHMKLSVIPKESGKG